MPDAGRHPGLRRARRWGHPVHVVRAVSANFMSQFDQPVGLGELIVVDTTAPVDVPGLANEVLARLVAPV